MKKLLYWIGIPILAFLFSCERDDLIPDDVDTETNTFVNRWMFKNMKHAYLWRDIMPSSIEHMIKSDPRVAFKAVIANNDEWSLIVPDVKEWLKLLEGKSLSTGLHLQLFPFGGSNRVFAVVLYVDKDSPADKQGLKRGDAIVGVNGILPTVYDYREVFFGQKTYEYKMAELVGLEVKETGVTIKVIPTELQENPIQRSKVIEHGTKKVGYLMYSSFLGAFNDSLSKIFADFKAQGVEELVVDLRYNSGGDGAASTHLASLIAPSSTVGKLFSKKTWNEDMAKEIEELATKDPDKYGHLKESRFKALSENINLSKVYFITSPRTASASEMLIVGLQPYMDVELIGTGNTVGKFAGSITFWDEENKHSWAIQPIVMKYENADGFTDFWKGLAPTLKTDDDFTKDLGDIEENMLSQALARITGVVAKKSNTIHPNWKELPGNEVQGLLWDKEASLLLHYHQQSLRLQPPLPLLQEK